MNDLVTALQAVPTPAQVYAEEIRTSEAYHYSGCLPPVPPAPPTPPSGNSPMWEWNQTDLSQFAGPAPTHVADNGAPGTVLPSLSFVGGGPRGPVLRVTGGDYTTSVAVFCPNVSLPWSSNARNARIELEVADMDFGGGGYAGVALGDLFAKTYFGHSAFGVAEYGARLDGAALFCASGTTGSGAGKGGFVAFDVRGQIVPSGVPVLSSYTCNLYGPGRRSGAPAQVGGGNVRPFGDVAEPAAWIGSQLKTLGLMIQGSGGNPFPPWLDVLSMRIFEVL